MPTVPRGTAYTYISDEIEHAAPAAAATSIIIPGSDRLTNQGGLCQNADDGSAIRPYASCLAPWGTTSFKLQAAAKLN